MSINIEYIIKYYLLGLSSWDTSYINLYTLIGESLENYCLENTKNGFCEFLNIIKIIEESKKKNIIEKKVIIMIFSKQILSLTGSTFA